jgi:hypothetical protein
MHIRRSIRITTSKGIGKGNSTTVLVVHLYTINVNYERAKLHMIGD